MKKSVVLWMIAAVMTLASAYYQRVTGPTYPLTGSALLGEAAVQYHLLRSHGGDTAAPVRVPLIATDIHGTLFWKRFKTDDPWTRVAMMPEQGFLRSELPPQPPAGKLEYYIVLERQDQQAVLPVEGSVVIRFKGEVPLWLLVTHVMTIFGAMLLSTRTGLEVFSREPAVKRLTFWTIGFLIAGGFIFGPAVQWYAFGDWWTGWPLGTDLTDNKTAVALLAWIIALVALFRSRKPVRWSLMAAVVTLVVFLIPHSLFGSELDYRALDAQQESAGTAVE